MRNRKRNEENRDKTFKSWTATAIMLKILENQTDTI